MENNPNSFTIQANTTGKFILKKLVEFLLIGSVLIIFLWISGLDLTDTVALFTAISLAIVTPTFILLIISLFLARTNRVEYKNDILNIYMRWSNKVLNIPVGEISLVRFSSSHLGKRIKIYMRDKKRTVIWNLGYTSKNWEKFINFIQQNRFIKKYN